MELADKIMLRHSHYWETTKTSDGWVLSVVRATPVPGVPYRVRREEVQRTFLEECPADEASRVAEVALRLYLASINLE